MRLFLSEGKLLITSQQVQPVLLQGLQQALLLLFSRLFWLSLLF